MQRALPFSPRALIALTRKQSPRFARALASLLAAISIFVAAPVRADNVRIDLQNGSEAGGVVISIPEFVDTYDYALPEPIQIYSDSPAGTYLGTLLDLSLSLDSDPGVTLNFHVVAGASTTHFTVSSGLMSFPGLTNAQGFATAAITVTDDNSNGANATGTFAGGTKAFEAVYNGGSVFADLVSPITSPVDDSAIGSERYPASGNQLVGSVNSMQTQFDFNLSAYDSASGTSRFNIIGDMANAPEPSSLALALAGSLALLWHARRRKVA